MNFIFNILKQSKKYKKIIDSIKSNRLPFEVTGLSDIHKSIFLGTLFKDLESPILFIAHSESAANKICENLKSMGIKAEFYPARDFIFYEVAGKSFEYEIKRLDVLNKILEKSLNVVVTCIDAALQLTISKSRLLESMISLKIGQEIVLNELILDIIGLGYEKSDQVNGPGQFSIRGGILDIFTLSHKKPFRIEFFGDEIDTISEFDLDSQRRLDSIKEIVITPSREILVDDKENLLCELEKLHKKLIDSKALGKTLEIFQGEIDKFKSTGNLECLDKFINIIYKEKTTLFDFFDKNTLLVISEPLKVEEKLKAVLWQFDEDYKIYLEDGILFKELGYFLKDQVYFIKKINELKTIYFDIFSHGTFMVPIKDSIEIFARQLPIWNGTLTSLKEILKSYDFNKHVIAVLAGTSKNAMSISKELNDLGISSEFSQNLKNILPGKVYVISGSLSDSLEYIDINFVLITHSISDNKLLPKKKKKIKNTKALYSLEDLNVGDYVVHVTHGIGIFKGIHKVDVQNIKKDYIKIEYAKKDFLYVPVTQLDLIDKYIGPRENCKVSLNKLGSSDWQKTKARAKAATKNIAKELIKLYSQRMNTKGFAFREDDELQKNFEAYFEYEETPDQLRCIDEIKADMQSSVPMDRLLCGDVGFGKTEVAMRAAFKCVSDSKQCAILVPTTILAWQHYQTLLKRFENFPIKIELLSRFRTAAQQAETLKRVQSGETDIVVGTHRLVQKDVSFKNLGLAIIDEEQRFGVKQKEKFKTIARNVDVLTLSATPIPRTLNMAMSGIRDMSTLEEAPGNRYPVQTYVLEHNQIIINEAIRKELRRGGQVYYLHNNVGNIMKIASFLGQQIPEAKIAIGHGKMSEKELSEVWQKVILHEVDILVCTTIIETGVDIKNVNTLIIDNADKMGLSQLHQIRGRVGRSDRKAFAYFTFNKNKILSEISQKRLAAIREFTEFGSGLKIAMRDLELRGAGNILSGNQHGHIEDVGYDMYLKLLNQSISEEKGEKVEENMQECLVDVQISAYIPEKYIQNINQRIEIYRKISEIRSIEDSEEVLDELIDRFGEPPKVVCGLINIALIRNVSAQYLVKEIKEQGTKILIFGDLITESLVTDLLKRYKGKISIVAGVRPHITIDKSENLDIIENLKEIFKIK